MGKDKGDPMRRNAELADRLRRRDQERVDNPGDNWSPVDTPNDN